MSKDILDKPAPPLTLPGIPNGDPFTVPIGKQPVVLFFFPQSGSMGCTIEACSLRDAAKANPAFTRHPEVAIIGISADPTAKQQSFADKQNLPFTLLSDAKGDAARAYGLNRAFFGMVPGRSTFFIDAAGIVKGVYTDNLNMHGHTKFVEKHIKQLDASS